MKTKPSIDSHIRLLFFLLYLLANCATSYDKNKMVSFEVQTFRRDYQNIHLVRGQSGKYLMIDAGGYETAPELERDILSKGIDPRDIEMILITHGHWDHVAGARYFQEKYKIPVLVGKGDHRLLTQGKSDKLCPTDFMARSRTKEDEAHAFQSPKVEKWVETETKLESLTSTKGRVVPLPGHTDGSLVFVIGNSVFVGDLFRGSLLGSNPEVHFYNCDLPSNREDIKRLLEVIAPDTEYFFPGHFGPVISRREVKNKFGIP